MHFINLKFTHLILYSAKKRNRKKEAAAASNEVALSTDTSLVPAGDAEASAQSEDPDSASRNISIQVYNTVVV